jgi:hypothetical protein
MKNFTVKLVELGNPFLDIVDVRWGRFHCCPNSVKGFALDAKHSYIGCPST